VIAGTTSQGGRQGRISSYHSCLLQEDEVLQKFWEMEERNLHGMVLSPQEKSVMAHFRDSHRRTEDGRFVVPLPRRRDVKPLGESRSQAVRRFLSLERSLCAKGQFQDFSES
jgi:hypothetical protein